jgi:hypothetical protein
VNIALATRSNQKALGAKQDQGTDGGGEQGDLTHVNALCMALLLGVRSRIIYCRFLALASISLLHPTNFSTPPI